MSESLRNILFLIGVLMVGGLGWFMFDQNRQLELQMTGGPGVDVQVETRQFINQQQQLRQLSVDSNLFRDEDFQGLYSITAPVPSYPAGRTNPFTQSF